MINLFILFYIKFIFYKKMSILEEMTYLFLKKQKIEFIAQKRFDFIGHKTLDFYLPQYKVAIECQGVQHYQKNNNFFNSKEQQKRDKDKIKECQKNGVKIVYFTEYKNKKIVPKLYKKITYYNLRIMFKDILNEI